MYKSLVGYFRTDIMGFRVFFCIFDLQVSSDLSIVDTDVPISLLLSMAVTMNAYANLGVLAVITWQVLFVSIPVIYMLIRLQVNQEIFIQNVAHINVY